MKSLTAAQVSEPLYAFVQMAFTGKFAPGSAPLSRAGADKVLLRISNSKPIPIKEAMGLESDERRALYEFLVQYVMFLTMFDDLQFPPDFLIGTDETCLGTSFLAYAAKHQ